MRRTLARFTMTAAATVGLAAATYVQALGLGEIDVSSNLNQRFVASIPLTDISAEDLETVTVAVAPNEAFGRAGLERAEYLSSLSFEIKNDRGRPRVVVTSSQIAREPVLDLLVQARWSGGKIVRDYTILLDPAEVVASRPVPAVVVPKPAIAPAPIVVVAPPAKVVPKPAAPAVGGEFYETPYEAKKTRKSEPAKPALLASDAAFDSATGSYGPVVPKETLWSIAAKVRPSSAVTMDQVLLALSESNPVAIQRGTTVSKGSMLRVPSAERMLSTPAAVAKVKLQGLRGGKVVEAKPLADTLPAAAAPKVNGKLPVAKPQSVEAPKPPAADSKMVAEAAKPAGTVPAATAATAVIAVAPVPATSATAAPADAKTVTPVEAAPVASTPQTPAAAPAAPAAANPASAVAAPTAATVAAVAKSPLAQPLPEQATTGFLDEYRLPVIAAALATVLGGGLLLWSRRRKAEDDSNNLEGFKPGDTSSVVAPSGGAGASGRLGDPARNIVPSLGKLESSAAILGLQGTQQLTQPVQLVAPSAVSHQATLILDPEAAATLNNAVKASAVTSGGEGGFDRTSQIQVDTLNITLGDNDPLSEADFHLAYGLYDEAILLLKNASAAQPKRSDFKLKLAETYFAAGRPMEFQEAAEELKGQLDDSEWSKLAIMGSQICPDVALFQSDAGAALGADFDLAFDEEPLPRTPGAGSIEFSLSTPSPSPASLAFDLPLSSKPSPGSSELRLSLDDDYDEDGKGEKMSLPPAGLDDNASIDFMLGQSLTPLGAGLKLPDASDLGFNLGSSSLNIELPKFDITRDSKAAPAAAAVVGDRATIVPAQHLSLSLQDLEVSITPRQSAAESSDDELNTKLDLARAYVEMGDNEMARSLLLEVQQQGGDRHQQEAASLLQRLPA